MLLASQDVAMLGEQLSGLRVRPLVDTQVAWAVQSMTDAMQRASRAEECDPVPGRCCNENDRPRDETTAANSRRSMGRVGLGWLLEQYGLQHETKDQVKAIMKSKEG